MPTGSKQEPDAFNDALMGLIRAKMGKKQINIADLARTTDIPRSTLSRIINSKRQPELDQVRKIAIALDTPLAHLFTQADEELAGKSTI